MTGTVEDVVTIQDRRNMWVFMLVFIVHAIGAWIIGGIVIWWFGIWSIPAVTSVAVVGAFPLAVAILDYRWLKENPVGNTRSETDE